MMKRWNRVFVPIVLILAYLVGFALGLLIVCGMPIQRQVDYSFRKAHDIADAYLTGAESEIEYASGANMFIMIYDADKTLLQTILPTNNKAYENDGGPSFDRYLTNVLQGSEEAHPLLSNQSDQFWWDVLVLVGVPIYDQQTVVGAVFLVKNLMDLPQVMLGYFLYYTICFWSAAILILFYQKKKRKLDETRQTYIANITHALKTPISSIKALAETLCADVEPDPNKQKRYCSMILQEANRQSHMVQNILQLAKLQSDEMRIVLSTVTASEIMDPIQEKYAPLFDYMGISFHISDDVMQLPPFVTNAASVIQILQILLDNALKFVPESGDVWITAIKSGSHAVICVRDNGIGMKEESLPYIFDRFYKFNHNFNESGSGLGLAIAKETCSKLNEKIWVKSEFGHGSSFFFTIRLK